MPENRFTITSRLSSFSYAISGLGFMLRTQHNAWLHFVATMLVCIAGLSLHIGASDWRWLILAITLVWFAEAVNTAFEHLCDVVSPEFHASVKTSKDIAAGAALICTASSALLGVMVFLPYIGV